MKLREAVIATWAVNGQELDDLVVAMIVKDLAPYPPAGVLVALSKCRKELSRRMTLRDVIERIPGGRPGPEVAWATMAPALNDERVTLVATEEMMIAFGIALNLSDDPIAARMAFKEIYAKLVSDAEEQNVPIRWRPSLGHDAAGREGPIADAVEKGLLPKSALALPNLAAEPIMALAKTTVKMIEENP